MPMNRPPNMRSIQMCRLAGIGGPMELRPYFFLTREEFAAGKISENQVVMQSSTMADGEPMRNRQWYPYRFQELCSELQRRRPSHPAGLCGGPQARRRHRFARQDHRAPIRRHPGEFVRFYRPGRLSYASCPRRGLPRRVIIYGGRERPTQTGYVANKNLYTQVGRAPCWLRNPCDYDRKCMDLISVSQIISAAAEQISRYGTLLEVQTAQL